VSDEQPERVLLDHTYTAPGVEVHVRVEVQPPVEDETTDEEDQDEQPAGDAAGEALTTGAGLAAKAVENVASAAWDLLKPRREPGE
jgi:hypothetical protein